MSKYDQRNDWIVFGILVGYLLGFFLGLYLGKVGWS